MICYGGENQDRAAILGHPPRQTKLRIPMQQIGRP